MSKQHKSLKSVLACLLCVLLLTAMLPMAALASSGEASGESGGSSGLSGKLALSQYVFVASEGEIENGNVSADCYGVYAEDDEMQYAPADVSGDLQVYLDTDLTPAEGMSAAIVGGDFFMTGVAETGNVVYYVSPDQGESLTTIYVVNSENTDNAAVLSLADGTSIQLTTYAPNMANGDYTAIVGENTVNGETSVYIGANRTARSVDNMTDLADASDEEKAVAAWWLQAGVTNSGISLTEFGENMYNFEYVVAMYRMFQIINEQMTFAADFVDASDYVGGMGSNDQFSDAVSATMVSGIWNGIYTQWSDTPLPDTEDSAVTTSGYLLENILDEDGNAVTELGVFDTATVEFIYVGLFNAFRSPWSHLSDTGKTVAEELEAAAAAYDGGEKSAPEDYTNEAKIAAVSQVVMGEDEAPAGDTALSKIEALTVLYNVRDCVASATYADSTLAEAVGSSYADMTQWFGNVYTGTEDLSSVGIAETTDEGWLITSSVDFVNTPIGAVSAGTLGSEASALTSPVTGLDGAEAATGTENGEGVLYNASLRNAYYREGIGAGMAIVGKDTHVTMTSDDGSLVISGKGGSMAGTAYVAFGASLQITNAVAFSSSQHLTNNLYNGTIHYIDSLAVGNGRVYSSDFWGGYQVYEDSVASGGNVTDEPTTLIVKNSVFGNSVGGNGYASQYFENSVLNVGTASFQNTTSLITDTGSLTLVNSVMNSSSATLLSVTKGENLILTLVDSTVNLSGGVLASLASSDTINHNDSLGTISDEYDALFDSEIMIYLYGSNTINATEELTASVADGATLTIYGDVVDKDGNAVSIEGANIVSGSEYGTLTVVVG